MPAPDVGRDAGGRLEDRRERPQREREVADREVVAERRPARGRARPAARAGAGSAGGARRGPASPPWRRKTPRSGRLRAWSSSTCSRNATSPSQASSASRGLLGGREHLVDVLGEDHLDERLARREVAVERPDPDARAAGDLLERRVRALLGEDLAPGCGQLGAVPGCVTTELGHSLQGNTEPEGASVCGSGSVPSSCRRRSPQGRATPGARAR